MKFSDFCLVSATSTVLIAFITITLNLQVNFAQCPILVQCMYVIGSTRNLKRLPMVPKRTNMSMLNLTDSS